MCIQFTFLEEIMEHKSKLLKLREDHNKHKDDTQDALSYYRTQSVQTQAKYAQITSLLNRSCRTKTEDETLSQLQHEYSAFVSADYMMSKNLPYWGESPQPAKTYYQMKLVCDVFGIVDHSQQKSYTYLCDELALGLRTVTILSLSFNTSLIPTLIAGFAISLSV